MANELSLKLRIDALVQGARDVRALTGEVRGLGQTQSLISGLRREVIGLVGAFTGAAAFKEFIAQADQMQLLSARLKLVTKSQEEYTRAQQELFDIAQRTQAPLKETVTVYTKIDAAIRRLGGTQTQALVVTELLNKSLKLSGASGGEAAAAMLQFGQALASGTLQGDELRSILENAPRLARALADGLGVSIGQLRKMGTEGELTIDKIVKALISQRATIDKEAASLPETTTTALTKLGNAAAVYIGQANQSSGISKQLAGVLVTVADNFGQIADNGVKAAEVLAVAYGGKVLGSLINVGVEVLKNSQALLVKRAAAISATQAELQFAAALVAEAEASVAAATGIKALSVVQTQLLPARQRLSAAQTAVNAAEAVQLARIPALARLVAGLGGPIGIVTSLLFAGVTAWQLWGKSGEDAVDSLDAKLKKLEQEHSQSIEAQDAADKKEVLQQLAQLRDLAEKRKNIEDQVNRGNISREVLTQLDQEIAKRTRILDLVGRRVAARAQPTNQFPDLKTDPKFVKSPDSGLLAIAKARAEGEFKILKENLEEQEKALEFQLSQNLISLKDYYTQRIDIVRTGLQAEIASKRQEIKENERVAATATDQLGKADQNARLEAKARVITLNAEIVIAEKKISQAGIQGSREWTIAQKQLVDSIVKTKEELLDLSGQATSADRRSAIARQFQDLREKLEAAGDTKSLQDLDHLIDVKTNLADFQKIEDEYNRTIQAMRSQEESLNTQREAGLLTESQARAKIVDLHKQTAAAVDELIPKMETLAAASGNPESIARVKQLKQEVATLKIVVDDLAIQVQGSLQDSFANFFVDITSRTKSAKQSLLDFASAFIRAMQNIIAQRFAERIFGAGGPAAGTGGAISGFIRGLGLHSGGVVGRDATFMRSVPASMFIGAPRFHGGGIVGGEVPAILQEGEEVITRKDPRHSGNGGGAGISVGPFYIDGVGGADQPSQRNVDLLGRMITSKVTDVIRDQQRPGGLLSSTRPGSR